MKSFGGISEISYYEDKSFEFEELANGSLELAISNDDKVHIEEKSNSRIEVIDDELKILNYSGKIFIPKNCVLDAGDIVERSIVGIIGSPAYITGNQSIDLIIQREANLNLSVYTTEPLRINGMLVFDKSSKKFTSKIIGRTFDSYESEYMRELSRYLMDPRIEITEYGIEADFGKETFSPFISHICKRFRLVYITNMEGSTNLFYTEKKQTIEQETNSQYSFLKEFLEKRLKKVIDKEDYHAAQTIKNSITLLEMERTGMLKEKKF